MATLADVARLAGVSKSTASRALSGGTVSAAARQSVLVAAEQLKYHASPAAVSLATGKSGMLGVIVPQLNSWYVATLVHGIAEAALEREYDIVVYDLGEAGRLRERVFERFVRRRNVDAVVSGTFALHPGEIALLASLGMPAAALGEPARGIRTWCLDDHRVGREATNHLLGLGHRDIVHVGGRSSTGLALYVAESQRKAGYELAMREAGAHPRATIEVYPSVDAAYELGKRWFTSETWRSSRPTAIFASIDEIGFGLMLALRELGLRVPEDVSIVGCGDHAHAAAYRLTTMRQRPASQGGAVVDWLIAQLTGAPEDTSHTVIEPEFVLRESTARPRR